VIGKDASSLELPRYRHIPGSNPRPDCTLLETVADQAPALTEDSTANANIAWHYGIRLFNAGYYWESHEVLEAVWINASPNSRERYLLQAVIHLANARLKASMHRYRAVSRLHQLATECVDRAFPTRGDVVLLGVRLDQLEQILIELGQDSGESPIELVFT